MEKRDYELTNRLEDFIDSALYKNAVSATHFLNPYEQSLAVRKLRRFPGIKYKIEGGYEGSERNIVIVYPDNDYIEPDDYLALVKIDFTKFDTKYVEHRMILGSTLALGIKRDGIGDILLDKKTAYIVATKKMAEYININLLKVGSAHISTTYIEDTSSVNLNFKEPKEISGTIASLRIDCILALALKTSRAKANDLVKNQMVYVNWQLVSKSTVLVEEDQVITIRQKGRVILKNIGNNSRKNRVWVKLQAYF